VSKIVRSPAVAQISKSAFGRHFTSGRLRESDYMAGLETWATNNGSRLLAAGARGQFGLGKHENFVHRGPVISDASKTGQISVSFAQQGRFPRRPCSHSFFSFHCFAPCCVSIIHGQGLIHIVAELGSPTA
jgi:hypothetical protein